MPHLPRKVSFHILPPRSLAPALVCGLIEAALPSENAPMSTNATPILGVSFDLIGSEDVYARICLWRKENKSHFIMIANPHSVLLCHRDPELMAAARAATLRLPDGIGVILAADILGYPHCARVTGPDLMLQLCARGREIGLRHFFYGGGEGVAEKLVASLSDRFPGMEIAGAHCPPFRDLTEDEQHEARHLINESRADILWVGLGAPKQEKWIYRQLPHLRVPAIIGIGAAFDFHSGNIRWAPAWIRKAGLEWAFRLAIEPRRMIRRNLDSPLFLVQVLLQRMLGR